MPDIYVKDASTWKKVPADGIYVKDSGLWKQADFAYVKVAGVWTLAYVSDNVGPDVPTSATATWNGNALRIAWTNPADADFSHVNVYVTPAGYSTYNAGSVSGAPSEAKTFDFTSIILDNVIYSVTLTPYDTNGNAGTSVGFSSMSWTGAARGRTPLSTYIDPTDSGSWRYGAWNSGVGKYAYHGTYGTYPADEWVGWYGYGTQFYDKLRGSTITAATFETRRVSGIGSGGARTASIWTSTCTSKASDPRNGLEFRMETNGMAYNGSADPWSVTPVSSDWRTRMASYGGTPRFAGVGVRSIETTGSPSTSSYMKLYGQGMLPGTIIPGRIWVTHTG